MLDPKVIEAKVKAAGISSHSYAGDRLDLYHKNAYRTYPAKQGDPGVSTEAILDAAIAEFKANTPKEWY